jgi:predicted RNA-binding protein with PIN domain
MGLPPTIEATLARGVAAYLRDAPQSDVPAKLRRFAGFRDQALKPHRPKLLAALDDDDFRAHVLEWLDDSPPLKPDDAKILAVAAAREEGWEEKLAGTASRVQAKPAKSEVEKLRDGLERERAKVAKLKEESRVRREEARSALHETKTRLAEVGAELKEARASLRALDGELKAAKAAAERSGQAAEKEKRSLKRDAERAGKARAQADERMAKLKRDLAASQRRTRELEDALARERTKNEGARKRSISSSGGPKARRRLTAPKGLLEDAPETLDAWLREPDVHLVVDGYNVGKSERGYPDLELEAMRARVVDEVSQLARRYTVSTIVVFDGAEVAPGTARRRRGEVKVEYSRPPEIADDHIVEVVKGLPAVPVVVVTSDRELQRRVAEHAATVAFSHQLLALIRG